MPVGPFSRYRDLRALEVVHATRGSTRSLPVRRRPSAVAAGTVEHQLRGFETPDLLALRYYGREDLYWWILDANGGRRPDSLAPGEPLVVPPLELATRVSRPG
jgi:nucleoid-associated protein YgaU